MKNLLIRAIDRLSSLLSGQQVRPFLAVVMAGLLLLTTPANSGVSSKSADSGNRNPALTEKVIDRAHQIDDSRPKTTGEWQRDADRNAPLGERIGEITEQSKDAFQEFGSNYVEGVKEAAGDARSAAERTGRNIAK